MEEIPGDDHEEEEHRETEGKGKVTGEDIEEEKCKKEVCKVEDEVGGVEDMGGAEDEVGGVKDEVGGVEDEMGGVEDDGDKATKEQVEEMRKPVDGEELVDDEEG